MNTQDQILLLVGEANGKLDLLLGEVSDHGKRLKSLEHSRTKYTAIFGFVGAGFGSIIGWIKGT